MSATGSIIPSGTFETDNELWNLRFNDETIESDAWLTFPVIGAYEGNRSLEVNINVAQPENWHIQIPIPEWTAEENKIYRFSMMARAESPINVSINYNNDTYKEGFEFNLHSEWAYYSGEFSSDVAGLNALKINMDIGRYAGKFEFDNIILEEVGTIDQSSQWYLDAENRIESIRKGDIPLVVVDDKGNRVIEGDIHLKLTTHEFPFGTSVILTDTISDSENEWYQTKIPVLFNSITIENDFKWVDYEPLENVLDTATVRNYITFADTNNLHMRGHVLAWGLEQYGFEDHWSRLGGPEFLRKSLRDRIIRDVKLYDGIIDEFDVWNEPFHEISHFTKTNHLNSESSNFWELMDSAFHWARQESPTADLYVNEYAVVSAGQTSTLYELVRGMLDRNVPITGIGAQCHFGNNPVEPELIRRRLDQLDQLGLKIKITEFDLGDPNEGLAMSEEEQKDAYITFLTTTFSHPAVDGITMWGFWDRMIWNKPSEHNMGSGIFNVDMTPKTAGEAVTTLLTKTWNTDTTLAIDESQTVRGFYGSYTTTINVGEKKYTGTFNLSSDKQLDTLFVTGDGSAVNNLIREKSQHFSAFTDTRNRLVTVTGIEVGKSVSLHVMNLRGQVIYRSTIVNQNSAQFALPNLSPGVYLTQVRSGAESIQHKVLITR